MTRTGELGRVELDSWGENNINGKDIAHHENIHSSDDNINADEEMDQTAFLMVCGLILRGPQASSY